TLIRIIPHSSVTRRRAMAPSSLVSAAMPSRLRSIIDMGIDMGLVVLALQSLPQHRDQAMQCLGGGCPVLHTGEPDIDGARIAPFGLFAREIRARHDAQPGFAP